MKYSHFLWVRLNDGHVFPNNITVFERTSLIDFILDTAVRSKTLQGGWWGARLFGPLLTQAKLGLEKGSWLCTNKAKELRS